MLPIQQRSQCGGDVCRLPDQLPPGEPDDLIAEEFQLDIAGPVGLKGGAAAMRLVAVELDDQAAVGPGEIHDVSTGPNIHTRLGKAMAATEGQEARFELAAGVIRLVPVVQR